MRAQGLQARRSLGGSGFTKVHLLCSVNSKYLNDTNFAVFNFRVNPKNRGMISVYRAMEQSGSSLGS